MYDLYPLGRICSVQKDLQSATSQAFATPTHGVVASPSALAVGCHTHLLSTAEWTVLCSVVHSAGIIGGSRPRNIACADSSSVCSSAVRMLLPPGGCFTQLMQGTQAMHFIRPSVVSNGVCFNSSFFSWVQVARLERCVSVKFPSSTRVVMLGKTLASCNRHPSASGGSLAVSWQCVSLGKAGSWLRNDPNGSLSAPPVFLPSRIAAQNTQLQPDLPSTVGTGSVGPLCNLV